MRYWKMIFWKKWWINLRWIKKILGVDAVIKCSYAYEQVVKLVLLEITLIGFGTGKVIRVNNNAD
jgi:hypothetical protein